MIRDRLPQKYGYALDAVAFIFGTLLFLGIAYASLSPAFRATRIRDFQGEGLRVPIYPVWWVIIAGSLLCCHQCLSKLIRAILLVFGKAKVESLGERGGVRI
jgi:TRAP-type mannitol/chloroaromatic compound transport system permease small subunit